MSERQELKPNSKLSCDDKDYYVVDVAGFGGSCIVYNGYYIDNLGNRKMVRIKECYPNKLSITRGVNDELLITQSNQLKFDVCLQRMRCAYQVMNRLYNNHRLTNSTSNSINLYELNNTIYVISTYNYGNTLEHASLDTLKDAVTVAISVAKNIEAIHASGYLYLDIKPDNIFIFDETKELVNLFDFDSVVAIDAALRDNEWRPSYSLGFSALEQRSGNVRNIGEWSDVYGIGALMYYLIFGETPTAMQGESGYSYDYSSSKWGKDYPDRLFFELDKFFSKTLCSYHKDRYQTMAEARDKLEQLVRYADNRRAFVRGITVPATEMCLGREAELADLSDMVANGEKCIIVSGIGGVGKSTLVRHWINDNRDSFDGFVYLYYRESLIETINDDNYCVLNNCTKLIEETNEDYYKRKLKGISDICRESRMAIVIDNYDGNIDDEFEMLISSGATVIAITRQDLSRSGYPQLLVTSIKEDKVLFDLIEKNLLRNVTNDENAFVKRIIEYVKGHTLSLELVAKQVARNSISFEKAVKLIEENGLINMGNSELEIFRDGKRGYDRFAKLATAIFADDGLTAKQVAIMKLVALFDAPGVPVQYINECIKYEVNDSLSELEGLGWLYVNDDYAYTHPLIQETIITWKWNRSAIDYSCKLMGILKDDLECNKKAVLALVKSIITNSWRANELIQTNELKGLTYETIMSLPNDQDRFILRYADKLFKQGQFDNAIKHIELLDFCIYLECQRGELGNARLRLREAKALAKKSKDNYVCGIFCDASMDYYEEILNGAYDYENATQQQYYNKLLRTSDSAIAYMSKAAHEKAPEHYVKYLLGKACLLIRSYDEGYDDEIRRLIMKAKPKVANMPKYSESRAIFCATMAWYYTLAKYDEGKVTQWLSSLKEIDINRDMSELELINYYYIPAANMKLELGNKAQSEQLLMEAIEICKTHPDVETYIRKMADLQSYITDVQNN